MKKFVMFLVVLGLLPGCRHEDKKSDAAGDLVGTWMGTCTQVFAGYVYSKGEIKFEANSFSNTLHLYGDSNCTTMTDMTDMATFSGTYKTGNSITTSSGNKATEIDFT